MHEAAEAGHTRIVKWLIEKGADTVARDNNDYTPYDLAFQKGWKQVRNVSIVQACAWLHGLLWTSTCHWTAINMCVWSFQSVRLPII